MKKYIETILSIVKYWVSVLKKYINQSEMWIKNNFCRITHQAPTIMSIEDTINYILKNKCSISRFGDGEIVLIAGKDLSFQTQNPEISKRLSETLQSNFENLLICIPSVFTRKQIENKNEKALHFWKWHLNRNRKNWYKHLNKNQIYGDAFISRPYMDQRDKSNCGETFKKIKKIWKDRDVIIVEGEKSRLGVDNDLFDEAKRVRRILGPSKEGFSKYNELMAEIRKDADENTLILLALGPTASIMAPDLCNYGYQAIDIGNIDLEYEWFLMGATEKIPVKNRVVYESKDTKYVEDVLNQKYSEQIIATII